MAMKTIYLSINQISILFINSDIRHTFGFQKWTEKKETEFLAKNYGFSIPYIFATQCTSKPLIIQTMNSFSSKKDWNITGLHHQVSKKKGLEKLSLTRKLSSLVETWDLYYANNFLFMFNIEYGKQI